MEAYELTANITADGKIRLSDFYFYPHSLQPLRVKVIILVSELEEINSKLANLDSDCSEENF